MSDSSAIPVTNSADKTTANVAQDDARNAESAVSGKVPKSEVEDLKDSIGGGETLDNEAGVTTRGAENDAYAQEKKVDNLDL